MHESFLLRSAIYWLSCIGLSPSRLSSEIINRPRHMWFSVFVQVYKLYSHFPQIACQEICCLMRSIPTCRKRSISHCVFLCVQVYKLQSSPWDFLSRKMPCKVICREGNQWFSVFVLVYKLFNRCPQTCYQKCWQSCKVILTRGYTLSNIPVEAHKNDHFPWISHPDDWKAKRRRSTHTHMIQCSCPSLQINSHFPQICHQEYRQVTCFKPCIILDAIFLSRPTDKQSLPFDFSSRKLTIKSGDLEDEVCSIQLVFLLRPSIGAPSATSLS